LGDIFKFDGLQIQKSCKFLRYGSFLTNVMCERLHQEQKTPCCVEE